MLLLLTEFIKASRSWLFLLIFRHWTITSLTTLVSQPNTSTCTDPFCAHSSPGLHGPQSGFSPIQIFLYKMAAHWWYSSSMGLQIGKWELIVGSKTQQASLQSPSFSQNVPRNQWQSRKRSWCDISSPQSTNYKWPRSRQRGDKRLMHSRLLGQVIHIWAPIDLDRISVNCVLINQFLAKFDLDQCDKKESAIDQQKVDLIEQAIGNIIER